MSLAASLLRRALDLLLVRPRRRRRHWLSYLVLALGLATITSWQLDIADEPETIDATYRVTASKGVHFEPRFFFFQYHLGLYPLMSEVPARKDTKNEAERILRIEPEKLYQELSLTFRSGDHGRVFLFYVDKWLGGDARTPSFVPAHKWAFILGLDALFVGAWLADWTLLGVFLVAFIGSNPMQLHAAYVQENVFSWGITALVVMLGLHLPLIAERPTDRRRRATMIVLPIVAGAFIVLVRTFRSEPAPLLLSAALTYLLARHRPLVWRAAAVGLLGLSFAVGSVAYQKALVAKIEHTKKVLRDVGARPYEGPIIPHHEFWAPVWCGLGDFDTKYGYEWRDQAANKYALKVLEERAGHKLDLDPNTWFQKETVGGDPRYHVVFAETPGYYDALREKVLGDIGRDPAWYLDILWSRTKRIFTETTPITLAVRDLKPTGNASLVSWLTIPLLAFFAVTRRRAYVTLLLFPLPLSIPALIVYSGGGLTYYGCHHLVTAAVLGVLVLDGVRARLGRRS